MQHFWNHVMECVHIWKDCLSWHIGEPAVSWVMGSDYMSHGKWLHESWAVIIWVMGSDYMSHGQWLHESWVVITWVMGSDYMSHGQWLHAVPPINFQNLPPMEKIKYNKILTYILRSIFLEIPHLELPRWRKTSRDMNGKGECHVFHKPTSLSPINCQSVDNCCIIINTLINHHDPIYL
jgi:hypothetical protein